MAITISGQNNNDKILASDGVLDQISGFNVVGVMTATTLNVTTKHTANHIDIGSSIQLGNAGIITATTLLANVTGNINHESNLLLQISGSEKFRVGNGGQFGIAGANYGTAGQVFTSGGSGSAPTWSTINSDKITEGNTEAEVIDTGSDGHFKVTTEGTERLRIDSSGRVMIGTTTEGRVEADDLTIATSGSTGITLRSNAGSAGNLFFSDGTSGNDELRGILQYHHLDNRMSFSTNATRRLTIDSSGRLLLHYDTASRTVGTKTGQLQVINTGNNATISIIQNNNAASAPFLCFGKTRSGNTTGNAIVQNNDSLGQILFCGADGANLDSIGAWILAQVDGAPGSNDMPGRLIFSTTADGSGTPTERLRIDSAGQVLPGADDAQNLGSSTKRWANIYAADMHYSNEGGKNSVDGTWGSYTIQEGESDLYLLNNRNGKKYKFVLQEVS